MLPLLKLAVNCWIPSADTVTVLGETLSVGEPEDMEDPPPQAVKLLPSSNRTGTDHRLCLMLDPMRCSGCR